MIRKHSARPQVTVYSLGCVAVAPDVESVLIVAFNIHDIWLESKGLITIISLASLDRGA